MQNIREEKRKIEQATDKLRSHYNSLMKNSEEYKELQSQLKVLQEVCESQGHVKGNYWDNGLGWEWWYCANCGISFDKHCYIQDNLS